MVVLVHPRRIVLSRPATRRANGLFGIGDDYGASQDNAAAGVTADPGLMNEQQTALTDADTNPASISTPSTPINWGAIASITSSVAQVGAAGAGIYVANQNQKTAAANAQTAGFQAQFAALQASMPSWVMPVALGGGALLLLMAMTGKKSGGSSPQYIFMPSSSSAPAKTNPRRRRKG